MRRLAVAALAFALSAPTAQAGGLQTVLTPESILYAIDGNSGDTQLLLSRREGADTNDALLVPGTEDRAIDSDVRLLFDSTTSTLFVLWHKADAAQDSILLASLDAKGRWSEPLVLSTCSSLRRVGLQTTLTRAIDEQTGAQTTLVHATWWGVGSDLSAEYALVAFEGGQHVSTDVAKLDELLDTPSVDDDIEEFEDTGAALHPPLALARAGDTAVDIVYGGANSTKITRVRVDPRRVKGDARIWKPVGRSGGRTGRSRMVSDSTAPVQAFISKGRIVLYRPDEKFRFMVLENGEWTPERMIQLDQNLTSDELLRELRATVDELAATDAPAQH